MKEKQNTIREGADCTPGWEKISAHMNEAFIQLPARLIRDVKDEVISTTDLFVYVYLLFRQGGNNETWVGFIDIQRACGYSKSQIARSIKSLKKAGHIRRTKTRSSSRTACLTRVIKGKVSYRGESEVSLAAHTHSLGSGEVKMKNIPKDYIFGSKVESASLNNEEGFSPRGYAEFNLEAVGLNWNVQRVFEDPREDTRRYIITESGGAKRFEYLFTPSLDDGFNDYDLFADEYQEDRDYVRRYLDKMFDKAATGDVLKDDISCILEEEGGNDDVNIF